MKKYYQAYDERYKIIHEKGYSWSSYKPTPIVLETIIKYQINNDSKILEIGCGEGRDAFPLLEKGYQVLATDISPEAIEFDKNKYPMYRESFQVLDCLSDDYIDKYDFIYAVALIHMLVVKEDRHKFYEFIRNHLEDDGITLICSMGDGEHEFETNVNEAFEIVKRNHESGEVMVSATSCKMVSFKTFEEEIKSSGLTIIEEGITSSLPDFDSLMYVVVKK